MIGTSFSSSSARSISISSMPVTNGSWMSVMTRSGLKVRAVSNASLLSVTGSVSWPCAVRRSQNSLMLRALSSTTRILAKLVTPNHSLTQISDVEPQDK